MTEAESEEDSPNYDFENVISRYRELGDEIGERRRVTNIEMLALFGMVISLALLITIASRNGVIGRVNLPRFLVNIVTQMEGIANFIKTGVTPLIASIPPSVAVLMFVVSIAVLTIFESKRSELDVTQEDVFKAKVASAAATLREESPSEAAEELRLAMEYGTWMGVIPEYKVKQTKKFLRNLDMVEDEEEIEEKIAIVLSEVINDFEEESENKIAAINRELEERAASEDRGRSHVDTFMEVIGEKLPTQPKRFDLTAIGVIIAIFFLGYNQFALLLAALLGAFKLRD